MPEFIVPANIIQGATSGSQAGIGTALGQIAQIGGGASAIGVDAVPTLAASVLGQVGTHSIGFGATDLDGDTANDQPAAFRRAFDRMVVRGGRVEIIRNGVSVFIDNCAAAFFTAAARFWVDPADVGVGPGQIPPTPATLMLAQLDGHPSVFVRRTSSFRGLVGQQPNTIPASPLVAIQQAVVATTPVDVFVVNRPPTHSQWALSIDGVSILATFEHPPASNLRRPGDIYKTVVGPAIANVNSNAAPIRQINVASDGVSNAFLGRGLLSRLNYTEYARFIAPLDKSAVAMTTILYPP